MARTARTTARTARDLLDLVLDAGWEERDAGLSATDPLGFPGYGDRDPKRESVISADGTLAGLPVVGISFEFDVFGGSMGVAAGEKIARAFERAVERRAAVIALTASGGARMQEGMPALAQMAKTVLARRDLTAARLPFLAYLTDPTTGGVYASFASLADVLWAEPGATIGFAGPRVAEQVGPLDDASHTAEFSLDNGLVDDIDRARRPPRGGRRVPARDPRARRADGSADGHRCPRSVLDRVGRGRAARHPGRPSWSRDPRRDLGRVRRASGRPRRRRRRRPRNGRRADSRTPRRRDRARSHPPDARRPTARPTVRSASAGRSGSRSSRSSTRREPIRPRPPKRRGSRGPSRRRSVRCWSIPAHRSPSFPARAAAGAASR